MSARKKPSNAAPGQFYGYSVVQGARLIHRLLEALPGEFVAVEGLDDISLEGSGRAVVVEQDKSGLAHNPVSNGSIDLWKTIYNWLMLIRDGSLTLQTRFVLYVAQGHSGSIVEKLNACQTEGEAKKLIEWLRNKYWGIAPLYEKKLLNADGLRKFLDPVLEAEDEVLMFIFRQFEFIQGSGSPYEDIKKLLSTKAIGAEAIDPILSGLIGWSQQHVAKSIENKKPPIISQIEFQSKLHAFAKKFDRAENELISVKQEITAKELSEHLRSATYVQQLGIINLEEDILNDAVIEYLRTRADVAEWAMRGHIVEESYAEYQQELTRVWRKRRAAISTNQLGKPEDMVGKSLYFNCAELRHPLQRMEVPAHFTLGSFHLLADKKSIGWHPRYLEVLEGKSLPTKG